MAYVYADLDALAEYQKSIIRTLAELERQADCEEELIASTRAAIRIAIEAAEDAERAAHSSYQQAEDQLFDAQRRVDAHNSHLQADEEPATVSEYYYDYVEEKRREYAYARARLAHAEETLAAFEDYVRSYRQKQEAGISDIKKLFASSGKFFECYVQKLVAVKKCTCLSGDSSGQSGQATSGQGDGSGYSFPYQKTTFSETFTYTDPKTKQRVTWNSNRTVYENSNLDPNLVIPAGTQYGNGRVVQADITNLELMEQGKAPFISNPDGTAKLVPLELHHLIGDETIRIAKYFSGAVKDGSLMEIASTIHDKYDYQMHFGTPSFRKDCDGEKSADAVKFEKFRVIYWKHRAKKFREQQVRNQ